VVASLTSSGGFAHLQWWLRSPPVVASLTSSGGYAHPE